MVVAQKVCGHLFTLGSPSQIKHWAEEQLPLALVRHRQAQVAQFLQRQPFTAQELELEPLDAAAHRQLEALPALAYGTTLLTVVVAAHFILYLQLGDGDLLTVSESGDVARPIPKDPRLIANETTSLCSPKAWNDVQIYFQTLAGAPPALILAATDGYANAYRDDVSFQQVARNYWALLRDEGEQAVKPNLTGWLNEASQQGSGDDITIGLIWRPVTVPDSLTEVGS